MVFFEDEGHKHLHPLTLTRPVDDLRIGILKIHEKWLHYLMKSDFTRTVRLSLKPVFSKNFNDSHQDVLWINSRYLPEENIIKRIRQLKSGNGISFDGIPVVVKLPNKESRDKLDQIYPDFSDTPCEPENSGFLLNRVWELFQHNGEEIEKDFRLLSAEKSSQHTNTENSIIIKPARVHFGDHAKIDAGVILDATEGPIYVGPNVNIMSGSIIKGPAAICDEAVIKMGAKVYPNTTIGPACKVGGEVKNVIFQGFSNKVHEGFVGNSLIGEWCNLGAGTNTSNLKNNYKPNYLINWETGKHYETGVEYCGTIMGDHSKTGINTMLNTGTICGVACNLFSSRFTPKIIPSFSWIGDDGVDVHHFDKAMETAERAMEHRNIILTEDYRAMMQSIFNKYQSKPERL
ncbi:MAG: putative sugar nucleotidyl transferase [Balneolales bacterium]